MNEIRIIDTEGVGSQTVALELETPDEFDAEPGQFVLLQGVIDGEKESGYYTISSPTVDDSFQVTVEYDEQAALGLWLSNRSTGESIGVQGPLGDIRYTGGDAVPIAAGPGIGPAIGITERAVLEGAHATLIYVTEDPIYEERMAQLKSSLAKVNTVRNIENIDRCLPDRTGEYDVYLFGYNEFIESVEESVPLVESGSDDVHVERFGPRPD